jgi:hypothetical protein
LGDPPTAGSTSPPTRQKIVGTATFPAVGYASFVEDHPSVGTGALFAFGALPAAMRHAISGNPDRNLDGPALAFVRFKPGVPAVSGRAGLERIATAATKILAATVSVIGVQRPPPDR